MTQVTVVYGPPCGGKTTYVAAHRQPDDVVLDLDAIAQALGGPDHDADRNHWQAATIARDALLKRVLFGSVYADTVWIIQTNRPDYTTNTVCVSASPEQCHERAAGRIQRVHDAIDQWFTDSANQTESNTPRGVGAS